MRVEDGVVEREREKKGGGGGGVIVCAVFMPSSACKGREKAIGAREIGWMDI